VTDIFDVSTKKKKKKVVWGLKKVKNHMIINKATFETLYLQILCVNWFYSLSLLIHDYINALIRLISFQNCGMFFVGRLCRLVITSSFSSQVDVCVCECVDVQIQWWSIWVGGWQTDGVMSKCIYLFTHIHTELYN